MKQKKLKTQMVRLILPAGKVVNGDFVLNYSDNGT